MLICACHLPFGCSERQAVLPIGRWNDWVCSACCWQTERCASPIRPDFARSDRTRFTKNLRHSCSPGKPSSVCSWGDSFSSIALQRERADFPSHALHGDRLDSSHLTCMRYLGERLKQRGDSHPEGQQAYGNTLNSPAAPTRYGHCMTAYMSFRMHWA